MTDVYKRQAQPQRAYAYYLELQKTRDALLAALGDAQRNLLELEESALAGKAGQLQAGLRRFDLMSSCLLYTSRHFLARLDSSAETRTRERSAYAAFPFAIFIGGF